MKKIFYSFAVGLTCASIYAGFGASSAHANSDEVLNWSSAPVHTPRGMSFIAQKVGGSGFRVTEVSREMISGCDAIQIPEISTETIMWEKESGHLLIMDNKELIGGVTTTARLPLNGVQIYATSSAEDAMWKRSLIINSSSS